MEFQEYIDNARESSRQIPTAINKRWEERIVAQGLDKRGRMGAEDYLRRYGQRAGSKKIIQFALKATKEGKPEMALVFWVRAYRLDGHEDEVNSNDIVLGDAKTSPVPDIDVLSDNFHSILDFLSTPDFPFDPGEFSPMQP